MSDKLLYAEVPIFTWNKCSDLYEKFQTNLTENQICAGGNTKDSCQVFLHSFFS